MKEKDIQYLEEEFRSLISEIYEYMDKGDYNTAVTKTEYLSQKKFDLSNEKEVLLLAEIAGLFIDIGYESVNRKLTLRGLKILEDNQNIFEVLIEKSSYEYNIGNAMQSLFQIEFHESDKKLKLNSSALKSLHKAKVHYWRAYKLLFEGDVAYDKKFKYQLFTNLANTLSDCGRVVEALGVYDLILAEEPLHPNSNAARADCLGKLNQISEIYSIFLLYEMRNGYKKALKSKGYPDIYKSKSQNQLDYIESLIIKHGYNPQKSEKDYENTKKEYEKHSQYRKFCLKNHLALSTHSLYCKCSAARRDDLRIPPTETPIGGDFIPLMELILNRIKSEFSLARLLFYQAITENDNWETYEREVCFSELFEKEIIGVNPEMLRTSYRICYGILDKIAQGICKLFDLYYTEKENMYFESFWRSNQKRWEKINEIDNISLTALYSIACDLNTREGELKEFKEWRNLLEHEILIIRDNEEIVSDPYKIYQDKDLVQVIRRNEFKDKNLRLLQLCRAAIFSFVFCVRCEGRKLYNESERISSPIMLTYKEG